MAEIALILGAGATLIGSVIYALKHVTKISSVCCTCEQDATPSSNEPKADNDIVNFIKTIKEKVSPRKQQAVPKAVWASNSLPLPRRTMSES
jgi:hypothetical protein